MKKYFNPIICVFTLFLFLQSIHTLHSQVRDEPIYAKRRQILMDKIGEENIAIFKSPTGAEQTSGGEHKFWQNNDFYFMSGFDEPESAFLIVPGSDPSFSCRG